MRVRIRLPISLVRNRYAGIASGSAIREPITKVLPRPGRGEEPGRSSGSCCPSASSSATWVASDASTRREPGPQRLPFPPLDSRRRTSAPALARGVPVRSEEPSSTTTTRSTLRERAADDGADGRLRLVGGHEGPRTKGFGHARILARRERRAVRRARVTSFAL